MLSEYAARDEETKSKAVENKAKREAEKKLRRRRKFATKTPEVVRGPDGKPVCQQGNGKALVVRKLSADQNLAVSTRGKRRRLWQRR